MIFNQTTPQNDESVCSIAGSEPKFSSEFPTFSSESDLSAVFSDTDVESDTESSTTLGNRQDRDYVNASLDELNADVQTCIEAQNRSRKAHRKLLIKRMKLEILRLEKSISKVKRVNDRLRKRLLLKQLEHMRVDGT
jgi:hypothetical protein